MKVGKYFTLDEFTQSQTASRAGLSNEPPPEAVEAIKALCANVLDPLREKLGKPVVISSGYRSPKVNKLVGGSKTSQHMKGEAADIIVPGYTPQLVIALIDQLNLPFDQVIDEFGSWTHVSYKEIGRRDMLKARVVKREVVYERLD